MIALSIALASILIVVAGTATMLAVWLRTANAETSAARKETAAVQKLADQYRDERNGFSVNAAVHVKTIGELEAKVRVISALLEAERKLRDPGKEIESASTNDAAADAFVGVFARPLPKAGDSDPGGGDR